MRVPTAVSGSSRRWQQISRSRVEKVSRRVRVGVLGVVSVVAAGCTAGKVVRHEPEVRALCEQVYAVGAIDPVRDKILIPIPIGEGQPIEMLSNRMYPTDGERPAIKALSDAFTACNRFAEKKLGEPPLFRRATNDRIIDSLADLYAGDITYGGFAKSVLYIGERDQIARQELDEEIRTREKWRDLQDFNGN